MSPEPTRPPAMQSSPGLSAQGHPHTTSLARTDSAAQKEATSMSMVTPASDTAASPPRSTGRRRSAQTARVSLLWPSDRRRCWWYVVTCRTCARPHLGRSRELADVTRTRRLPCGHWVEIVIARTYGRPDSGGAA
jgi:hypothetical protein